MGEPEFDMATGGMVTGAGTGAGFASGLPAIGPVPVGHPAGGREVAAAGIGDRKCSVASERVGIASDRKCGIGDRKCGIAAVAAERSYDPSSSDVPRG